MKHDIIADVRRKTGLTHDDCKEAYETMLEAMSETLASGEEIIIRNFGRFKIQKKRARQGRNVKTGEPIEITARTVVKFKPSPLLVETDK